MSTREGITVRKHTFSRESQETLLEETLLEWRALGPAAACQAIYDMLDWWFTAEALHPRPSQPKKPLLLGNLPPACAALVAAPTGQGRQVRGTAQ